MNETQLRMRVQDHNKAYGSLIMPCLDAITQADATEWMSLYDAITRTHYRELDVIRVVSRSTTAASTGPTSLIKDLAVLLFASAGPFGLRFPIYGPGDIFLPDDITVDDDNLNVIAMQEFIVLWGQDRAGNAITEYLGGKRVGAGGP